MANKHGFGVVAFSLCIVAGAQDIRGHDHQAPVHKPPCGTIELKCADVATAVFDNSDRLWVTWVADGRVSVASSDDLGKSFSSPLTLPKTELPIDNGPDARPKLAVAPNGTIALTYATRDAKYNGHAFLARSSDGGKTFAPAEPMTSGSPSQRFEAVAFDASGRAFAAWIDKRNVAAAKVAGRPYAGAALAVSWADGSHGQLQQATIARDNTCECCRMALAFAAPGKPVVLFRNIFDGGIRDHAIITFSGDTPGPLYRVSDDDAKIDACPHQGPSLAISASGTYHVVWFALGRKLKGLYYARSTNGGRTFSSPMPLGQADAQLSRPYVLASGNVSYLAYKSFNGEKTDIFLMTSSDDGATWTSPNVVATTAGQSDHPLLVANKSRTYLSWMTSNEGYRLIALETHN